MQEHAASALKARIRADLGDAIRGKRADELSLLRSLLAAIDNAEAPALDGLGDGPSEIDRLLLSEAELLAVLTGEIGARRSAAAELQRLGQAARAEILLRQAEVAAKYLMPPDSQDTGASAA